MADFELVLFTVDDGESAVYTQEQIDFAGFLSKLDWEGGIEGLIRHSGARSFPPDFEEAVFAVDYAIDNLDRMIRDRCTALGVEY